MARRSAQPRRHRMRQQARRGSARAWVASGAAVSVKAFARRYGVDRYTAYEDLLSIGFAFPSGDTRWAVRPAPTPKRPRTEPVDLEGDWIWIDDQRMFVVGRTPGGAPYGWVEDQCHVDRGIRRAFTDLDPSTGQLPEPRWRRRARSAPCAP